MKAASTAFHVRLLREGRITVSLDSVSVDARVYPITASTTIEVKQRGSHFGVALLGLALGMFGIPATIAFNHVTPDDYSWVVGLPVAFVVAAIVRVLTMQPTYAVELVSGQGATRIFECRDHQLVVSLATALRDARDTSDGELQSDRPVA